MSAAVQHAEPAVDQLPLLQSPEPGSMHVSVWGRLTRQAEVRVTTDGSGLLIVQVLQGKGSLPFVAMRHVPADQLPALQHLAHRLQPGVAVVIIGIGLEVVRDHGEQVVRLRICEHIHLAPFCFFDSDDERSRP
jgi:hypothetical protein